MKWIDVIRYANKGNPSPPRRVEKSAAEWRALLPADVFRITREHGTERAHSSEMCSRFEPGVYDCACCATPLFDATHKFESGTGWPSFTAPIDVAHVAYRKDTSFGMTRVECRCNVCDAHLGHVFPDGPAPTGLRFCINALALEKRESGASAKTSPTATNQTDDMPDDIEPNNIKKAYIAGGCFWGMEELFRVRPGILDTEVGYIGGRNDHPTYRTHPGHAEGLELTYDATVTSFEEILDYFFRIHDPTTVDRQGNDVGSSYRSAIFFRDEGEKAAAEQMIERVNASGAWKAPVATTLEPYTKFWPAEPEHQDYLQLRPNGYTCHYERPIPSYLEAAA